MNISDGRGWANGNRRPAGRQARVRAGLALTGGLFWLVCSPMTGLAQSVVPAKPGQRAGAPGSPAQTMVTPAAPAAAANGAPAGAAGPATRNTPPAPSTPHSYTSPGSMPYASPGSSYEPRGASQTWSTRDLHIAGSNAHNFKWKYQAPPPINPGDPNVSVIVPIRPGLPARPAIKPYIRPLPSNANAN